MAFLWRMSVALVVAASAAGAFAQTGGQDAKQPPASITTPDTVKTRIDTLEFKDGAPSKRTLDEVYGNLDRTHAFRAFVDTMQVIPLTGEEVRGDPRREAPCYSKARWQPPVATSV